MLHLLKRFSSPKAVLKASSDTLSKLLSTASRGRYSDVKAIELKKYAKTSVGIDNSIIEFQIKQTVKHIEFIEEQLDEIDEKINELFAQIDSPIASIPGIGSYNGSIICGYIGTVSRFSSPSQILAFAGLDPVVRQSGKFNASSTRMSKRGSSLLRYGLINASQNVVKNVSIFKAYYDKKITEGKSHYCALGHVANKLVRLIFTLLSKHITFYTTLCK